MPRLLLGVFILLLVSVSSVRAQGDAALLTVGPETVSLEEFNYHFSTSSEKRADVFVQTLARFKQKVLWAKELKLDTLASYRSQRDHFRNTLLHRRNSGRSAGNLQEGKEWIKLVHITYPLSPHSSKREERQAVAYMDSVYIALNEKRDILLESLPWIQTRYLLNEWKVQLSNLAQNEYSQPFMTPLGVHVIAWTDRRVVKERQEGLGFLSEDFRMKSIEEGLLVASLERHQAGHSSCSELELETYFEQHKEEYGCGMPHYQGAVIHCRDKKEAKRIKKYLKKYPEKLWMEAWKRMPADVSSDCLMEVGLFPIGRNPYVDKLVFKCGEFQPKEEYPYVWVLGRTLKKGPTSYKDVSEKLEKAYRKVKKEAEMKAFVQKYQVEINEEVLKTVNRCGNK